MMRNADASAITTHRTGDAIAGFVGV